VILSIETSTNVCSVALHNNGNLVASQEIFGEQTHAGMLTVMIDNLLQQTQTQKNQLLGVAVSHGAGSYTGLRIGSSTAKGLCFGLDIPLFAVATLEAMALQVAEIAENMLDTSNILLCPMIDARRMEVYTALYTIDLQEISKIEALVITPQSFENWIEKYKIVYFGNGAAKCKNTLQHPNFVYIDNIATSARTIGKLAHLKPQKVDTIYYESLYLKEYEAKISTKKL
jgi:tRNA threonylcarbamoyladenosine biosynthesis protein TsaB